MFYDKFDFVNISEENDSDSAKRYALDLKMSIFETSNDYKIEIK